ncbi:hypothetical protein [Mycoplasma sp. Ms02]|uniref:hypothetical protein n=1 Tax=Mycoplasma sp. Ms02 TaxID=353851 RepID=UPI001C895312|nr:hypothetical protein [Mycoplasma sp. Ms02]QZE12411.1 hypothetical protein K4L35_00245 [Mycoplasma sp. Ms02]
METNQTQLFAIYKTDGLTSQKIKNIIPEFADEIITLGRNNDFTFFSICYAQNSYKKAENGWMCLFEDNKFLYVKIKEILRIKNEVFNHIFKIERNNYDVSENSSIILLENLLNYYRSDLRNEIQTYNITRNLSAENQAHL